MVCLFLHEMNSPYLLMRAVIGVPHVGHRALLIFM